MTKDTADMQLWAKATASEQENERRVVNWLGVIALASLAGVVVLAEGSGRTVGIDTAVIVALVGIIAQCASSLGTRRTRMNATDSDTSSTVSMPTANVGGGALAPPPVEAPPLFAPDDDDHLDGGH